MKKTKNLSKHRMSRFLVSGFRTWFVKNTYFNKFMPSPTLLLINRILKSINIVFKSIISKLMYLNIWNNSLLKTLKNIFINVLLPSEILFFLLLEQPFPLYQFCQPKYDKSVINVKQNSTFTKSQR